MLKKNEHLEIEIVDIGSSGEGIGKINEYVIFVEGGIPGDILEVRIVKVKKNYSFGKLMQIVKPSSLRAVPECPVFSRCGGCSLQHMSYEAQLEFKEKKVKDCLKRIGGFENLEFEKIVAMEDIKGYRNKAQYPVGDVEGEIVTGFFASRSHNIVPVKECLIQRKENVEILEIIKKFMTENGISPYNETNHKGIVRHVFTRIGFKTEEIMVCIVINGKELPNWEILVENLKNIKGMKSISLNINTEKTNVIMGKRLKFIWGENFITDFIGDVKFQISPLSFFQVNPIQTEKLYKKVVEFAELTGNELVVDAYCGIGTISLFMQKNAKKVIGIEIIPEAIEDARKNAEINNVNNVEFVVGNSEEVMEELFKDDVKVDIIVVDPPRKGCEVTLLDTIVKMKASKVIYVSCDPATLARDLKILGDNEEYKVERVCTFDCFPWTNHVESVVLLSRKDG